MEREEQLAMAARDSRLIHMAEHLIFPLLQKLIESETEQMSALFLAERPVTVKVAYITALIQLRDDLTRRVRKGDKAVATLHELIP